MAIPESTDPSRCKQPHRLMSRLHVSIPHLPRRALRRSTSSPTLNTTIPIEDFHTAPASTTRRTKEASRSSSVIPTFHGNASNIPSATGLSIADRVRAVLDYRYPLKRRSRFGYIDKSTTLDKSLSESSVCSPQEISEPILESFRHKCTLTPSDAQAVLETFDELQAYGLLEFTQNHIRRHSTRFAFSTPNLLDFNELEGLHESCDTPEPTSSATPNDDDMKRARPSTSAEVIETGNTLEACHYVSPVRSISSSHSDLKAPSHTSESHRHGSRARTSNHTHLPGGHILGSIPGMIYGTALHAHHAITNFIAAAKVKRFIGPAKIPSHLSWEGEEGALAFFKMTNRRSFNYKNISSIQIVLNANDWTYKQDDHYAMALAAFTAHPDHCLEYLEINIKGNTLFTRHTLTLGAANMRMAYLKQIGSVSEKYAYWQRLYNGTATRETMSQCPPVIRKEIKRIVEAFLEIKNIPRVVIHGAMEAQLKDEIIATCQAPNPIHASSSDSSGTEEANFGQSGGTLPAASTTAPITAPIFKLPDANTGTNEKRKESLFFKKPKAKHSRFSICNLLEITRPTAGFPGLQPDTVRRQEDMNKVTKSGSAVTLDKPLPSPPPISLTYPGNNRHFEIYLPLPPPTPPTLPSMPSEYIAKLPSSAHLFIDQELPIVDDSDSNHMERGGDKTVNRYSTIECEHVARGLNEPSVDQPYELLDFTASENDPQFQVQSSQTSATTAPSPPAAMSPPLVIENFQPDAPNRRSTRSNFHRDSSKALVSLAPARKRRRFNSRMSSQSAWEEFAKDQHEQEVIDTTGSAPLTCGTIEELVRISAHRSESMWNEGRKTVPELQTQIREGLLGDCVLGWKVVWKDGQWVVGREDEQGMKI